MQAGTPRTGLFSDDTEFQFSVMDTNNVDRVINTIENRPELISQNNPFCQTLIFCDDKPQQNKWFIGRMYRKEPEGESLG